MFKFTLASALFMIASGMSAQTGSTDVGSTELAHIQSEYADVLAIQGTAKAEVLAIALDLFRTMHLLTNVRLNCGSLQAFSVHVRNWRGTHIAPADADALIAAAARLRADIGCRS